MGLSQVWEIGPYLAKTDYPKMLGNENHNCVRHQVCLSAANPEQLRIMSHAPTIMGMQ